MKNELAALDLLAAYVSKWSSGEEVLHDAKSPATKPHQIPSQQSSSQQKTCRRPVLITINQRNKQVVDRYRNLPGYVKFGVADGGYCQMTRLVSGGIVWRSAGA